MSHQLTVVYNPPKDPAAFDSHYEENHSVLAAKLPGLQSYASLRPEATPDGHPASAYLVAWLQFADREAMGAALASEEGKAVQQDLANFASGGVTILAGEVTTYV